MKIIPKQLLLGMSLGAVVVFMYGYTKFTPQEKAQTQKECETTCVIEDVSVNEVFNPKVTDLVSWKIEAQVQFLELNKYKKDPTKVKNNNQNLTPTPIPAIQHSSPTPVIKSVAVTTVENKTQHKQNADINNVIGLIERYAAEYGVDKDMMVGIAKCESGFRENAVNGPYAGIYQFVSGTWISNRRAMGLDENLNLRYSAEESTRTAAFKMSRDGFGAWPVCQHKAKRLIATTQNI